MYNTQLIKILKTFSKNEIRELGRYVNAPCHNSRADVIELFDYLTKHHGSSPSVYQKEMVFETLFPDRAFDDGLMRFIIHSLLKVTKIYLVQKELESDSIQEQILLAKAMKRRGLDDFFEKEINVAYQTNINRSHRHADYFLKKYQIQHEHIEHNTLTKRGGAYHEMTEYLTYFFVIETLRSSILIIANAGVSNQNYTIPLLNEVLNWLEKKDLDSSEDSTTELPLSNTNKEKIVLASYYNLYKALTTKDSVYFNRLKKMITDGWQFFPENELRMVYLAAINFCIQRINSGEISFRQEAFDLYETGLANHALFENGILTKFTFKNAVSVGIMMQKYEWVRDFIENSKQYLHIKDREAAYNYNLAVFYFRKGDYDQAMPLLHHRDFGDVLTNLAARALLLRIYFDTKEYDALMSLMDSFQTFLNRQKNLNYQKDNYSNLIRMVRKILRVDLQSAPARQKLRDEIQQTKYLAEKNWLLEKLVA